MTRTILITGATAGFGRATAERFASAGWRVVACGRRAERLRAAVAAHPVRVDGIEVPVTLSIGIAHARPGGDVDLDALLATADRRLYLAKRAGRDRVIDRDVEVELPARA